MFINEHSDAQKRGVYNRMNSRQGEILEYLKKNGRASVKHLAAQLYVSEMTIRRDLAVMEKDGYLRRYNGGAVYLSEDSILPFEARHLLHEKNKETLFKIARQYLRDELTVYLDSSSTCAFLLPFFTEYSDLLLVTNSVYCAQYAGRRHIRCILAGGDYFERDMCTVGSITEAFLRNINPDLAFFSTQGISEDGIISDGDEAQTAVRKIVLQNSRKKVFLFDREKQNKKFRYTLCSVSEADDIILI